MIAKSPWLLTLNVNKSKSKRKMKMLEKLAKKRNLFAIIYGVILLALFIAHLIFGNAENKMTVTAAVLIGFPFFYFGFRLIFKTIKPRASQKAMRFFSYFFLFGCVLGIVLSLVSFIRLFPNGFSPILSCVFGGSLAILSDASKSAENT